jgi:hypothetical protein
MKEDLTAERLRSLLDYAPGTGVFRWRVAPNKNLRIKPGHIAGSVNIEGYRSIRVAGHSYQASHLAWLYMTGNLPRAEMDHVDCNTANDAFSNLREATREQNTTNRRVYKNNTSGCKGVVKDHRWGKWQGYINVKRKRIHLGTYHSIEEARKVYAEASAKFHGEFGRI